MSSESKDAPEPS